jgi:G3E family GTPase
MLHFRSPDIGLFGRRQRHARGHRIPVAIASSAAAAQDRDTAVLVDAFGADEALLPEIACQCCTVRVELQAALRRLLTGRGQRHFSCVTIETAQELAPILRTFVSERALAAEFYVESAPLLSGDRFTLTDDTPLPWESFSRFMATLTALRGGDLLHVKGMLNIEGCRGPVVVHCMQHLAHAPVELQTWPGEDRASRLEFITRNVEEKTVQNLFDSIRALAPPIQTQTSS